MHGDRDHSDSPHFDRHGDRPEHADGNHGDIFPHFDSFGGEGGGPGGPGGPGPGGAGGPGPRPGFDPVARQVLGLVLAALNDFDRQASEREGLVADRIQAMGGQLSQALHTRGAAVEKREKRLEALEKGKPGGRPGKGGDDDR